MYKQLVINVAEHETRVALLEDGEIAEFYIDRGDDSDIAGNIYKGRVLRVLPGMQAAFVNIGLNQAAFIYVDDVFYDDFKEYERLFEMESEADEDTIEPSSGTAAFHHRRADPRRSGDPGSGGQIPHGNQRRTHLLLYFPARSFSGVDAQFRSYRHFAPD